MKIQLNKTLKSIAFAVVCVGAGCVVGSTMPHVTAQAYPPNPTAPRWEQFCELKGGIGHGDRRIVAVEGINRSLSSRGQEGWELAEAPVVVATTGTGSTVGDLLLCYRRPVPH